MFSLHYKKNNNTSLFQSLDKIGMTKIQNYVPLYGLFFSLNDDNYNSINLNHHYSVTSVENHDDKNKFVCKLSSDNNSAKRLSFFKFSPLLDPVKYLIGKYKDISSNQLTTLPSLTMDNIHPKLADINNSAYVDSFFSYLTSQLLHKHKFLHGLDFYGSFLSIKSKFATNVIDDLEYLHDSDYFRENKTDLFELVNWSEDMGFDFDTRHNKKRIKIGGGGIEDEIKDDVVPVSSLDFDGIFTDNAETGEKVDESKGMDTSNNLVFQYDIEQQQHRSTKASSTCSSRSSNTDSDEKKSQAGDEDDASSSDKSSEASTGSMNSDVELKVAIKDFPVQVICLECLDNTLDSRLREENEMDDDEWRSCLFQIVMMLIAYQKAFGFTHNDLHTNNIMFNETDRTFINYRFNNQFFKVPTFGRIYKIIDFGRAIYKFRGKTICSDSFHSKGDAATQYNCEPYFNEKKARLDPNTSFDLCRLACSLFDYFIDDLDEQHKVKDPIAAVIVEWCKDDKGRNVLYKKNGDERYPDFKLYKMIARTVTKHKPEQQVGRRLFRKFLSSRKKIGKKAKVIDIDALNSYVDE